MDCKNLPKTYGYYIEALYRGTGWEGMLFFKGYVRSVLPFKGSARERRILRKLQNKEADLKSTHILCMGDERQKRN